MIEALKDDALIKKIGGPFRLTALVQRRMKELIDGSRPLVETEGLTIIEVTVQEILQDKIGVDYDASKGLSVLTPDGLPIKDEPASAES